MRRIERRGFVAAGLALLLVPAAVGAQTAKRIPRIGFVSPTARGRRNEAFVRGMQALGHVDGRDVEIVMRFADGRSDRLPALVRELLDLPVDVLVVGSTLGARAARDATTTVPVVFAGSSDPAAAGVVANLARPGGNLTGTSTAYSDGFAAKWLELLREAAPTISRVAVLWSPSNASAARYVHDLEISARASAAQLDVHRASDAGQLDEALTAIGRGRAQGLIVTPSPLAASQQDRLVGFAVDRRLPAIYFTDDFVDAGGLMSYGPSIVDAYRRSAAYVDRILKGAKPGDLPVEQPTRYELIVNAKTARTLGLVLPKALLARADRMVE